MSTVEQKTTATEDARKHLDSSDTWVRVIYDDDEKPVLALSATPEVRAADILHAVDFLMDRWSQEEREA